jgi:hypothetical protein
MQKLCVGLAADCDHPEADVQKFMRENLKGAGTLPFAGFATADLQWVAGFAGYKDAAGFAAVLAEAEKSPLLQAPPATTKALEALVASADKSAAKGDWRAVLAASRTAANMKGRSPLRDKLAEVVTKGRAWADAEMKTAAETAVAGDRTAVRVALKKVASAFAGEPEAKDADAGLKAVDRLGVIEGLPADQQPAAREKAKKDFVGSRWASLFDAK